MNGNDGLRATRAYIYLANLRHNIRAIKSALPAGTAICAAVKADAYGHGVVPVSRTLRKEGVEVLGVATPSEGRELRDAGDKGRIILLGPTAPQEIPLTVSAHLEPMIVSTDYLDVVEKEAAAASAADKLPVHLKVDTGMGRVGCVPEEAPDIARRIAESPHLTLAGTATHFPIADETAPEHREYTRRQGERFSAVVESIKAAGIDPGAVHAANSGAIALHRDFAFSMARPGISLYGYGQPLPEGPGWKPVMEVRTRITALKKVEVGTAVSYGRTWTAPCDTWIATLPVGYADGYRRLLSGKARVLVGGAQYPVVGRICMDQCMIDLGPETDTKLWDEVILFGPEPAGSDAAELARLTETISYEITCGISARVPRFYVD